MSNDEYYQGQDDTINHIKELLEAYEIDPSAIVCSAGEIINKHKDQTAKGLADIVKE